MTTTPTRAVEPRPAAVVAGAGPLGRLADLAYRHRLLTVVGWLAALGVSVVLAGAVGGEFKADYSAPGSDSSAAQQLLEDEFPAQSGDTVDVVVRTAGPATAAAAQTDVRHLLARLGAVPHVVGVDDPYAVPGGIAPDGRTVVAHLRLDVVNPPDMPIQDSQQMLKLADETSRPDLQVALGGQTIQQAEQGAIGSEALGLSGAGLVLLIAFGSVVAARLPILVAVAGLAVSSALTTVLISVVDAPNWSTSLATMMGIGIGIDYVLLMVTRFRDWRAVGLDERRAVVATLDTAGRAVMLAGSTVVISMLGLFAMGLSFMRGAALVTILSVLVVIRASPCFLRCSPTSVGTSTGCGCRCCAPARSRSRPAVTSSRLPRGCPGADWSRGVAWPPLSSDWPCCLSSPRRSWASGSASPTPVTTAKARQPGRATTCRQKPSVPASTVPC